MEFLSQFLPIIIYFLLIIFLVIGIILGIRLIMTLNKIEEFVDDVKAKIQTLNGFFHIIDYTTDKIAFATDKVVEVLTSLFHKLIFRKKKEKKENE